MVCLRIICTLRLNSQATCFYIKIIEDHIAYIIQGKYKNNNFVHTLMMLEGGTRFAAFVLKDSKLICFKSKSQRIDHNCMYQTGKIQEK